MEYGRANQANGKIMNPTKIKKTKKNAWMSVCVLVPALLSALKSDDTAPLRNSFKVGYPFTPILEHVSLFSVQST